MTDTNTPKTTGTFDVIVEVGKCTLCESTLRALITYEAMLETEGLTGQTVKRSLKLVARDAETFTHYCEKKPELESAGGFFITTQGIPRNGRVRGRGYNRLARGTIDADRLALSIDD